MALVVTVDWDFFVWNGREIGAETFLPDGFTEEVPVQDIFGWEQDEGEPAHRQIVRWLGRVADAKAQGVHLPSEMNLREDRGCTPIPAFMDTFRRLFDLSRAVMMYADSHVTGMWAVQAAVRQCGGPVEVVNIDAHADLGYDEDWMGRKREGHYDCADWLHEAIRRRLCSQATVVYPDWKQFAEWHDLTPLSNVQQVMQYVRPVVWGDWHPLARTRRPVCVLLFVRSSTWTPPWMDHGFIDTVKAFGVPRPICLDRDPEAYGRDVLPSSATPRPWPRLALGDEFRARMA